MQVGAQWAWGQGQRGRETTGGARGAHPEEAVEALGVSAELGQVVHEAVALLIGEQVHQVAGVHAYKGQLVQVMAEGDWGMGQPWPEQAEGR